jgi:hypothetical protein
MKGYHSHKTDVGSQNKTKIPQVPHMYNNLNINLLYIFYTLIPIYFLTYLYTSLYQPSKNKKKNLERLVWKIDAVSNSDIY